jgi:hypothetical protein
MSDTDTADSDTPDTQLTDTADSDMPDTQLTDTVDSLTTRSRQQFPTKYHRIYNHHDSVLI